MEKKQLKSYMLNKYDFVKFTKTGNITQLLYTQHRNRNCNILKLNKEEYMNLKTGEIKECNHIENRGQNINTIRFSISNLRNIINNNFFGGSNELWVTLTFGDNKVYNSKELYILFKKFMMRLRYTYKDIKFDYIYVPEPHEKGDWHIHLLLKGDKPLFIPNKILNEIWGNGFVKVNRLKDIDNIGAYISAYLINIKDGECTKKGARLYLYPPNHRLYRYSKGIIKPTSVYISYLSALRKLKNSKLTYQYAINISDNNYSNDIIYQYFNSNKREL